MYMGYGWTNYFNEFLDLSKQRNSIYYYSTSFMDQQTVVFFLILGTILINKKEITGKALCRKNTRLIFPQL